MKTNPQFLFITCQVGAEKAVKGELARRWPNFRFAYSRPGFLTFKLPENHTLPDNFDLESTFARAYGFSLGKIEGDDREKMIADVMQSCQGMTFRQIHVWPRDAAEPGDHGFEPSITPEAVEVRRLLESKYLDHFKQNSREPTASGYCDLPDNSSRAPTQTGDRVLDCILIEPNLWWLGYHRVKSTASRFPGGMMSLELPSDAVSRAWLKMEEGLRWSRLPLKRGDRVAEIGSAPGGASQALLARGMIVTGVDPAEMAPEVLANPQFTHIRRRSTQVRRREFRKIRWLTADMNVAPEYTLDAVEAIVTHPEINIRGLLLTLKLPQWSLASRVPEFVERVRGCGYNQIQTRQLQYDRREICLAALRIPPAEKGRRSR